MTAYRLRFLPALFLLLALAGPLNAQEPTLELRDWRVQTGDDPRWAAPDFDDSAWQHTTWPRRHTTEDAFFAGTRWYRTTVELPHTLIGHPLAIGLCPLDEVFEVFINGISAGGSGDWIPAPQGYFPRHLALRFPASAASGPLLHLAIRRWTGRSETNYAALVANSVVLNLHPPLIGPAALIAVTEQAHGISGAYAYSANNALSLAVVFAGLLSLAVFFAQRTRPENLWLGLTLVAGGLAPLAGIAMASSSDPLRSVPRTAVLGLYYTANALSMAFLSALCPRLKIPLRLAAVLLACLVPAAAVSYHWQAGIAKFTPIRMSIDVSIMIAALSVAIALLREKRQAQSTILAAAVLLQPAAAIWFSWFSLQVGAARSLRYIPAGEMIFDWRTIALLLFAVTALVGLYLRHKHDEERRTAIEGDLGAARLVQESLLTADTEPGFTVDSVYFPAEEVGGDFFLSIPGGDGSQLIVTGDVSGKGLPPSLLVAAVVGAMGDLASRRPADVLVHLNRALLGRTRGGFVTCCCALFHHDDKVELANAGHLAPYLNGEEVRLDGGLPLGLVPDAEYAESVISAGNGRLTFLSDGVVEAADSKGELFGFERTRAISGKSPNEIAEAARVWGQNDDITVVTVRRRA